MDLLLITAIPFGLALLLALPITRKIVPKDVQTYTLTAVMLVLFGMLLRHWPALQNGEVITYVVPWMPSLGLNWSFYLDGLSFIFGLVVTGIGALIFFYAGAYFEDNDKQTRFNTWLTAFAGAMIGLVLSGNLVLMFIMWELTSITSFMLIGFYGDKSEDARYSARRALVITGGGGLALIAGVLMMGAIAYQVNAADDVTVGSGLEITEIESESGNNTVIIEAQTLLSGDPVELDAAPFLFEYTDLLALETLTNHRLYIAMAILIFLGAFTKSAQFPFHFWLPGAMTAPTPASAFLHSATMVKAGIYLLARVYPVMYQHALWQNTLIWIGLITMLISAVFALKQRDLKGLLAYSTTSWLGVLVALIGVGSFNGFKALTIGILAHAFYKAALFLSVGSIDHSTGTRVIDRLGGMWKYMPATGIAAIISALSMAGLPLFMGFVAKEVLLDASVNYMGVYATIVVVISAALTGTAGYILIWDVFFAKEKDEIHYHAMPVTSSVAPLILAALGTTLLPFLIDPVVIPLIEPAVPKEFELYLIPTGGFANPYFQLSLLAVGLGFVAFLVRRLYVGDWNILPFNGAQLYQRSIDGLEWFADFIVQSQNGRIRYYLFYILGVVSIILISSNMLRDLLMADLIQISPTPFNTRNLLTIMLLVLAVGGVLASVIIKRHVIAALALGIFGYAVAGIYVVESAPDVALVQFLVETLITVLVIIMISRISHVQRKQVADDLWEASRVGIWRDAAIATGIGVSVAIFSLTAVVNRPDRDTIAQWHLDNTFPEVGVTDVVSAILTDFRGMDTFVEIGVFAMCALGILALLALSRDEEGVDELPDNPEERHIDIDIATPFMRGTASLVFPFALMIGMVHVLYGADAPGDGFTAGLVAGLGIALGYIVFGFYTIRDTMFPWLRPIRLIAVGLTLAVVNAFWPILVGEAWMSYMAAPLEFAGIKLKTMLIFEIAIMLTVFGSVGVIMDAIAHPRDVEVLAGDETYDPNYSPDTTSGTATPPTTGTQPAGAD